MGCWLDGVGTGLGIGGEDKDDDRCRAMSIADPARRW
jgi:hypothetical protein